MSDPLFPPWVKEISELLRAVATLAGAFVAVQAFRIGRKYFDTAQSNYLPLERYKKSLSALYDVRSHFLEMQRLVEIIFDLTEVAAVNGLMVDISKSHDNIDRSLKSAMFLVDLKQVRTDYLNWYDIWFVRASDTLSLVMLSDPAGRKLTIARTKGPIQNSFGDLIIRLQNLERKIEPQLKLTL